MNEWMPLSFPLSPIYLEWDMVRKFGEVESEKSPKWFWFVHLSLATHQESVIQESTKNPSEDSSPGAIELIFESKSITMQ